MDPFAKPQTLAGLFDASTTILPRPPPPSPASPEVPARTQQYSDSTGWTERDSFRTPPSHALRYFHLNSSYSSDEASEDGDDVPPTPGDFYASRAVAIVAPGGRGKITSAEADLSKLLATGGGPDLARFDRDASHSLSPGANAFFPSFGDFLPGAKPRELADKQSGPGIAGVQQMRSDVTTSERIDLLSQQIADKLELEPQHIASDAPAPDAARTMSPLAGSSVFAPFATFSPNTDSFTFFPSPDWKASRRTGHLASREGDAHDVAVTTSAALRSPEPGAPAAFPMQKSLSTSHVILTPPTTPVRYSGSRAEAPAMQQSRSLPVPVALASPSRSPFAAPSPSPTRSSFSQMNQSHSPHCYGAASRTYPLSPQDTEKIAKLHNGRIPTLEQLCPEPVHPSAQPPIVNTGNQGVMVVQQGDWKCGTCSFVNWRRRKICLRCFPFANDIGNILTIQSQRAAHLATPMSAPAHQTTFLVPSPTRGHFNLPLAASHSANRARLSPGQQPYLLVPPPQIPQSASPTRSTFALQPPPSPTRHKSSHGIPLSAYVSPSQYADEEHYSAPLVGTTYTAAINPTSAGDLALRRASKMHRPSSPSAGVKRYPSVQPLNLANYSQRAQYVQAPSSSEYDRSRGLGGYFGQQCESPSSPMRYFHTNYSTQQGVLVGAEL